MTVTIETKTGKDITPEVQDACENAAMAIEGLTLDEAMSVLLTTIRAVAAQMHDRRPEDARDLLQGLLRFVSMLGDDLADIPEGSTKH